jgi:hypothetical protein
MQHIGDQGGIPNMSADYIFLTVSAVVVIGGGLLLLVAAKKSRRAEKNSYQKLTDITGI